METSAHACLTVMGAHSELTRIITGGCEHIITLYFLKNNGASYASTGYNSHHKQSSRLWRWAHSRLITDDQMITASCYDPDQLTVSSWHHNEGDSCSRLHRGLLATMETSAHACLTVIGAHSELTRIITGGCEHIVTIHGPKQDICTWYNLHWQGSWYQRN